MEQGKTLVCRVGNNRLIDCVRLPRGLVLKALLFIALQIGVASAAQITSDPRPLSQDEIRTFLPLMCFKAASRPIWDTSPETSAFDCQRLIGYGDAKRSNIALSAIFYGSLTGSNTNEAYISYSSGREPHANDFGGGILFSRSGGSWHLVRWYPGRAMRNCLALPFHGQQKMLCLLSYTGQGEIDTTVWIETIGSRQAPVPQSVIKAQDDRQALDQTEPNSKSYPCLLGVDTHKAMLLSVDDLIRSTAPPEFARSRITYAAAEDVQAACKAGRFENVRTQTGTLRYVIKIGNVAVDSQEDFVKTDY